MSYSGLRLVALTWIRSVRVIHSSSVMMCCSASGRTRNSQVCVVRAAKSVRLCQMSSSTKPPAWSAGSNPDNTDSKDREKQSGSNDGVEIKFANYIREKSPELYSLGQIGKPSSVINSVKQTTMATSMVESNMKKPEDWNDILNRWYQQYQDFIGITDMKNAQDRVTELSEVLHQVQSQRRELQVEIEDIQEKQVINHDRINKTDLYSQEHFKLLEQAREWNDRLKVVRSEFAQCERLERDTFTQMSAAIRDCHEQERMQAEQSKYWSIIASVVSAALASVITSINNWVRIREIKDHVTGKGQHLLDGFQQMHQDVLNTIKILLANSSHQHLESVEPTGTHQALPSTEDLTKAESGLTSSTTTQQTVSSSVLQTENSSSIFRDTKQHNVNVGESSDIPLSASVTKEDIAELTEFLRLTFIQQINENFAKERDLLLKEITGKLEAYTSRAVFEGERTRDDIVSLVKTIFTDAVTSSLQTSKQNVSLGEEHQEGVSVVAHYSYRRIATAMAVGAGIGTLATAFALKALGGSGV